MKASGEVRLFIAITVVAIALVAVAVAPTILHRPNVGPTPTEPRPSPITRETLIPNWSQVRGNPEAPFTLVEFGDYQCPSCKTGVPTVRRIVDEHKDKLNFVFHHFRINASHVNSMMLATAAMAAAEQGKFWEMHDAIYERQDSFAGVGDKALLNTLSRLAGDRKLDVLKFREALVSEKALSGAKREHALGDSIRITNTPSFFFVPKTGKPTEIFTVDQLVRFMKDPSNWK